VKLRLGIGQDDGANDANTAMDRLELAIARRPEAAAAQPVVEPAPSALDKTDATIERIELALSRLERAIAPRPADPEPPTPELTVEAQEALDGLELETPPAAETPAAVAEQEASVLIEPPAFTILPANRRHKIPALLVSLAGHVLVVALIATVSPHIRAWLQDDDAEDWSRYRVEPLRLNLADPIYYAPSAPVTPQKAKAERPERAAEPKAGAASDPVAAKPASPVPDRLQLPAPPRVAKNAPVILQPDFAPQTTPPPAALPPVAFWARQAPDLPKPPAPNKEIAPGRTEAPSPAARPAATPVLAVPNRETNVADVNVAMPSKQTQAPALPAPNSATVPVRMRDVTENHTASFDPLAGQAVNVVALAADRTDNRRVVIPRGLQNIPDTSAPGNSAQTGSAAAPSAQTKGANGTGNGASSTNSARPGTAAANSSENAAHRGDAATAAATSAAATPARPAPAPVTRIDHAANGSFDVVIMQSAARDDLPDVAGILSGNPVYTVYLRVGDRKEWLLEYCEPVKESAQASSYQINIDDAGSVTPPYPVSTVIPNSILSQPIPKHIVVQGMLLANGTLHITKIPDGPLTAELSALLSQWQFRPALKNKKAIDVEILLVIPPRA
jgi:hypothetical protein